MKTIIIMSINLLFASSSLFGQDLSGPEIVKKVNDLLNQETSYSKAEMTIITSSGKERTFLYDSWTKNRGEKNLIRYLEPRRAKDQATLMLNNADDIWMYFPRTQRVRKLATHAKKQKMEGSDFSYEDMGSGDTFITDYTAMRLDDEKIDGNNCYKLELTAKKGTDLSYSRLIMWVLKDNFVPTIIDFYDEDEPGRRIKQLVQSDIEIIGGVPTAKRMIMYNKLDNTNTTILLHEVKYNLPLEDSMFTERGLKK